MTMKQIAEFPRVAADGLLGVFFDIDDTFTLAGKIPAASFSSLWRLSAEHLFCVPITGRPAGWCDHIARMWPVTGVVGENGALYFYYDAAEKRLKKRFYFPPDQARETRDRLMAVAADVITAVPGTAFASDQPYRLFDVAIDFTEDVAPLSRADVDRICDIFASHGLTYKVSSVHVNAWLGDYDKLTMARIFSREVLGLDLDDHRDRFVFFGDSPNDEPMFGFFPNSVGVANVAVFLDRMKSHPAYVTKGEGGIGFAEGIDTILINRRDNP
jgi:HAD superfamily hydrolase (TIGR01484 family)